MSATEKEKKDIDQLIDSLPFWIKIVVYLVTLGILYIVQAERMKQRVISIRKLAITKIERDIMNKDKSTALRNIEFLALSNGSEFKSYVKKIEAMDNPAVTTMTIPISKDDRKELVNKLKGKTSNTKK